MAVANGSGKMKTASLIMPLWLITAWYFQAAGAARTV
jgi:hypothetical protein